MNLLTQILVAIAPVALKEAIGWVKARKHKKRR